MATKTSKGARQQAVRRARIAAAAEASRRQDKRKRWIVVGGVSVLIVAVVLGAFVTNSGGSSKAAGPSSSSCVAMNDDAPVGAPYVPVHVGPAPTTLVTDELRVGTGDAVAPGDSITVNYIGVNCADGKIFDSSYSRNQPASFSLDQVIPGWQQGIPGMQVGGQRLLGIPPDLAYGAAGRPGIPPNATLWFVVELVSIDGHASTTAPAESIPEEPGATGSTVPAVPPSS
jgi:peptidylprolyl isomerase